MALVKIIGVLVAMLVLAVGGWGGVYLYKQSKKPTVTMEIGPSAPQEDSERSRESEDRPEVERNQVLATVLPENQVEPGEILAANPPRGFLETAEGLGFSVIETIRLRQLDMVVHRLAAPSGMGVKEAKEVLAARFPGVAIDAHQLYESQGVEEYRDKLARPLAGWAEATKTCGAGIRLGMIDAGVDVEHPALEGQRIEYRSFHREDRRPGKADHGTAVAAMLVGKPSWGGLLPGAELMAANMFEVTKTGKTVGSGVGLLKAVDWLVSKQVQVVNLSVAGGDNKVVRRAFRKAREKGLILIAAAGNWGSATRPAYPAAYRDVLAVTAFDSERNVYKKANRGSYIDFAAPGVRVYTAVPRGGRVMSGTSFATPYLTVLSALQIEAGIERLPSTLREALGQNSLDLGAPGRDDVFGQGFVNLQPQCPR